MTMIIGDNDKESIKCFCTGTAGHTNNPKRRLNPDAQQLILEKAVVNRIRGEVDYANAFLLRSFRLSLHMEVN
jgi:hypothetical protein